MTGSAFDAPVQVRCMLIQNHTCIQERHHGMRQNVIHFDQWPDDTIELPCFTVFGRRMPNISNSPRTSLARSIVFFSNALRVLSKARMPWASRLFICTGLNQPVRST